MISFIISAYNRPDHLGLLLRAIKIQSYKDFEVILVDEWDGPGTPNLDQMIALQDERFRYLHIPRANDWGYTAKTEGAKIAKGDILGFSSDDGYYVSIYFERMVAKINEGNDFVYCNWLFDAQRYAPVVAVPVVGQIDVGGFFIKKDVFLKEGWGAIHSCTDGEFLQNMAKKYLHARVEEVLYVKN